LEGRLNSLQESEKSNPEQLALFIDAARIGLWDWEIESKELSCNERWAEIIGYNLAELQPLTIDTWSNLIHLDDIEKATTLIQERSKGSIEIYEGWKNQILN